MSRPSSSATPSGASTSARATRLWPASCRRRWTLGSSRSSVSARARRRAARARARRGPGAGARLCGGGRREEARDAGQTEAVLERQLQADLAGVEGARLSEVVIAYEPIWAIGTGRPATPEQAQEVCAFIRDNLRIHAAAADSVRILYGGSVKPGNADELMSQADIDGALVGGGSLDPADFAAIIKAAG